MCQRNHENRTCVDIDGLPIHSYACQVVHNYAQDLGNYLSYYLRPNSPPDEGFIMSITGGDSTGCQKPRELNVTFVCDPIKGIGAPR